jgi:transcriptional regulator with XRE-family HTH domain
MDDCAMDISTQRTAALRRVMGNISQKDFSDLHGLDASYLSQLLNGHRKLGEKAAANLEEKIGLPKGSLVSPPITDEAQALTPAPAASPLPKKRVMEALGFVTIPHLNVADSLVPGHDPSQQIEVIRDLTVHSDWLKSQGLAYSALENLAIITGDGDSMDPTFRDGDALLVDKGITTIRTDAVYAFTLDGDLFIKRLQRMTGGTLRMISDNPVYPAIMIDGVDLEKIHIHARVLMVWNARKL